MAAPESPPVTHRSRTWVRAGSKSDRSTSANDRYWLLIGSKIDTPATGTKHPVELGGSTRLSTT